MNSIMDRSYLIWYSLRVALTESMYIFAFAPFSNPSNSFPMLVIDLVFLLCSLCSLIFAPKLFSFLVIWLLVCLLAIFPYLLVKVFFHCFGMFYFFCIVLSCLDIFLVFCLLSPVPFDLFHRTRFYLCCFFFFVLTCSNLFPLFYNFCLLS